MSPSEAAAHSALITARLFEELDFGRFAGVFVYISMKGEPDTAGIIGILIQSGVSVFVPGFAGEKMVPLPYLPGDRLVRGRFGVMEPCGKKRVRADISLIDAVIAPGVVFDEACSRIGRGGGWYDRILKGYKGFRAGLAFDFQVLKGEKIVKDPGDEALDAVVSESKTYFSRRGLP